MDYPSFFRNVAKLKFAKLQGAEHFREGFLKGLIHEHRLHMKKFGHPAMPKLMDLLTDPALYKDKRKGHTLKAAAEQFQTEKNQKKMEMEFEEEKARKGAEIREKLRQEGEKFDAIFEAVPNHEPAVAEGTLYSSTI